MGSIPTRSRHSRHGIRAVFPLLLLLIGGVADLSSQAAPPPRRPTVEPDTTRRYISPGNALWRSLLVPGWGQARLNRKLAGGMFLAWEGVTFGMSLKSGRELRYLRRTNSVRAE
ncbi:MAG TPA: hypothetical protein VFH24_02965, partial [Gemmatimonadales bacterium]|nr:hypothetical protein [Gemmatimonadales bacterium]